MPHWLNVILMAEAFHQLPWVVAPSSKGSYWWYVRWKLVQQLRAEIEADKAP